MHLHKSRSLQEQLCREVLHKDVPDEFTRSLEGLWGGALKTAAEK